MTTHQEEHYYVSIKPALMEEFEKTESYLKNVLKQYFDQSKIELLLKETRAGYEEKKMYSPKALLGQLGACLCFEARKRRTVITRDG
jgi:hypothetical protein